MSEQLSLINAKDLPSYSGALGEDTSLICVLGNENTVRVPFTVLHDTHITFYPAPSTPSAAGESGAISWSSSGVFTYDNGMWGKTPRVVNNWDDFDADSRFLLVSKEQVLSEEELSVARLNLGLKPATEEIEGLVRITTDMNDNSGAVPTAAVIKEYIRQILTEGAIVTPGSNTNLSNYIGPVNIHSSDGNTILYYDELRKVLNIGSSAIPLVKLSSADKITVEGPDGVKSTFEL